MNLLIVDDESIEVDLIEKLLEKTEIEFAQIYRAYCVDEAINILKKKTVSVVICDIEMPGGSGHHLTEWIRKRNMDIEVIFSTGHAEFEYAAKALRLGAVDYLLKPIKKEALKKSLLKAISKFPEKSSPVVCDAKITVEKIKEYIKEHCEDNLNRTELAEQHFLHPNSLSRIFKEYTSLSLQDYIAFVRMEKAKNLLIYSNLSVSEIALKAGYSNTAYFIKQFKKEIGLTPKQFRNQQITVH